MTGIEVDRTELVETETDTEPERIVDGAGKACGPAEVATVEIEGLDAANTDRPLPTNAQTNSNPHTARTQ